MCKALSFSESGANLMSDLDPQVDQIEVEDKIMEKIERYVNQVIEQYRDKTILISIDKIPYAEKIIDILEYYNIQCEKGEVKRRDFYYILPKCYFNKSEELIGLSELSGLIYRFTPNDLQYFKYSLKATLTLLILAKSRTFYQIFVNNFLSNDKFSYFLVNSNDLWILIEAVKSSEFSMYFASKSIIVKAIGNINVVAYEPRFSSIPKYAILKINAMYRPDRIETSFDIIGINKEIVYHILDLAYDNMKRDMEEILNNDEQLQKLVSQIIGDNENS